MILHSPIPEPELEFADEAHICPRAGITQYSVYDARRADRRERILVGGVGTQEGTEALHEWVHRVTTPIPRKEGSRQPNLFPAFPGFNKSVAFRAELAFPSECDRSIRRKDLNDVLEESNRERQIEQAVELYYRQVKFLAQNRNVDVVVCVLPDDLYDAVSKAPSLRPVEDELDDEDTGEQETNFRRLLKARCMHLGRPIQIVRRQTLDPEIPGQQDEATKAWNLCTALYYKANQTVPWKMRGDPNQPPVCFVGIGFYLSRDRRTLNTSLAQVFDELGRSVILRGTPVDVGKSDRRPFLSGEQANILLGQALYEYEVAMDTRPARLVVHKSSNFRDDELEGMQAAAAAAGIRSLDFVTVLDSRLRLFRDGKYPPYRGTRVELDAANHLLYTRGSVEWYETYPGNYVPQPLDVRLVDHEASPAKICSEILALTKMNWNNTQFDGKYPITLRCARRVGDIMKYLPSGDRPQISYSYYM